MMGNENRSNPGPSQQPNVQNENRSNPGPSQQFNQGVVGVNFPESFTGVFLFFLGFEYLTSGIRAPESY